jgi:hypothetical protein
MINLERGYQDGFFVQGDENRVHDSFGVAGNSVKILVKGKRSVRIDQVHFVSNTSSLLGSIPTLDAPVDGAAAERERKLVVELSKQLSMPFLGLIRDIYLNPCLLG